MRNGRRSRFVAYLSLLLVLAPFAFSDTPPEVRSDQPIEIVAVKQGGIDLRVRNVWQTVVSVGVCDEPQRLSGLAYHLERLDGRKWEIISPAGVVLGDFPPTMLRIPIGTSTVVAVRFDPRFMGIVRGEKIRVVITVWHTGDSMVGWPVTVGEKAPSQIASDPFAFLPEKAGVATAR